MERRKFIQNSVFLGAAGSFSSGSVLTKENQDTFKLNYAPHEGQFENSAGKGLLDQIRYMHDQGFRAIEDNNLMKRSPKMQEKMGQLLEKLGMTMGVFVLDKGGNGAHTFASGKEEYTEIFLKGCRAAVDTAKRVNARWTTVVPGNYDRYLPLERQHANVIDTLRRGIEIMEPHRLVMVLEALSDTPDLYLRNSDQAYMLCRAVGSPSCKILFDIYHMQRNEGNLIEHIDRCWDEIAYLQVGDNPGRNEPGTGEIHYRNIFRHLYRKGYKGVVGMEHGCSMPGKKGEQALIDAYLKTDNF